jgi:hypothetical protein
MLSPYLDEPFALQFCLSSNLSFDGPCFLLYPCFEGILPSYIFPLSKKMNRCIIT